MTLESIIQAAFGFTSMCVKPSLQKPTPLSAGTASTSIAPLPFRDKGLQTRPVPAGVCVGFFRYNCVNNFMSITFILVLTRVTNQGNLKINCRGRAYIAFGGNFDVMS